MDIALRGLSALLMIALPLALGAYFTRRWHLGWGLALVGAVTFLLSQAGHIPFNAQVLNPVLARLGEGSLDLPLALRRAGDLLFPGGGSHRHPPGRPARVLRQGRPGHLSPGPGLHLERQEGGAQAL